MGLVLWVSHAATTRGSAPVSPIFGYPSIYLYTFCSRTTKFDVVTHVGRGLYLGVIHASHIPRERGSSAPQFGGFPVFMRTSFERRTTKFSTVRVLSQPRAGSWSATAEFLVWRWELGTMGEVVRPSVRREGRQRSEALSECVHLWYFVRGQQRRHSDSHAVGLIWNCSTT